MRSRRKRDSGSWYSLMMRSNRPSGEFRKASFSYAMGALGSAAGGFGLGASGIGGVVSSKLYVLSLEQQLLLGPYETLQLRTYNLQRSHALGSGFAGR